MANIISINMREHSWTKIRAAKPTKMSFSEWIETLATQRLEQLERIQLIKKIQEERIQQDIQEEQARR